MYLKNHYYQYLIEKETIQVNSRHNFAIPKTNFLVNALSDDNIIEGIEDQNKKFFLGVHFEVLNYLKEQDLIYKIPVVIITGDDTPETIKKAFSYPILDVLNKPFTSRFLKFSLINSPLPSLPLSSCSKKTSASFINPKYLASLFML